MLVDGAETLMPLFDEIVTWVRQFVGERDLMVSRIVDVGSGPGVGTAALADSFPNADLVAADASDNMLAAAAGRFSERPDRRLSTVKVDLSGELHALREVDLIWASLVLHHIGDETSTMRRLGGQLTPNGLLVVVEFGNDMSFLPADGGPESLFAQRLAAAGKEWIAEMRAGLPDATSSSDYPTMIADAGLQLLGERLIETEFVPPLSDGARRVVLGHLQRARPLVAARMTGEDVEALDALIDRENPRGVMRRGDLHLRDSRRVFVVAKRSSDVAG